VFPALVAARPVLALMHEASNAADLLARIGRAPSVRLVTYADDGVQAQTTRIQAELSSLVSNPRYDAAAIDRRVLDPTSACALAGRLADVLNRCVA
jgi:hypothetical protein